MTASPGVISAAAPPRGVYEGGAWRHRWALLTAASTLALIFIGGLVTSTESGLSVPDWPLSYGMLMPPMVGNVRFEHGHRMAAATVGLLTLILAVWTAWTEPRGGVRALAWLALGTVITQGVIGGLTVIHFLPPGLSVTHACLAQTFFCLVIALSYATSREWLAASPSVSDAAGLRGAAMLATGVVYLQLILGAVMRHIGAGLAITDFPLAFGRIVPPLESTGVAVHFAHRVGALAVLATVLRLALRCRRSGEPRFARLGAAAFGLVLVQLGLGAATVLTSKAVLPATAHVAIGAAVLGSCWLLTLRAFRHLHPVGRAEGVPSAAGHPVPSA